jgi:hypothetical protein
MKASDADRDAVLSDLSEHFQAGRLTAAELDERTGRALAARTWGELGELVADLPAARPASRTPAPASASAIARPQPPSAHAAPPLISALAGIAITAVVLLHVAHGGWGLIWPLLTVLLIARPMIRRVSTSRARS